MIKLMLFLHIFGFIAWMGGAWAIMSSSIAAKREDRSVLGPLVRIQAAIAGSLVGPGAGLTVVSGLVLTFKMYGTDVPAPSGWVMVMQAAGLLAGIVTLAFVIPLAGKLRRMEPVGAMAASFDAIRKRQKVLGMVSGSLGMAALVAAVMARF